eukprot:877825-Prorocentrum_lima.AAC.1
MGDAALASQPLQAAPSQAPLPLKGDLPQEASPGCLDPFAALQQHMEACQATLNDALRQNI